MWRMCAQTAAGDRMSSIMKGDFDRRQAASGNSGAAYGSYTAKFVKFVFKFDLFLLRGDFRFPRTKNAKGICPLFSWR